MKTIKIGKSSSNDFVVADDSVSRSHALLIIDDSSSITIKDLNSTNGTFVDGKRILEAKLLPGQTVKLGNKVIDWKQALSTPNKTIVHGNNNAGSGITPDTIDSKTIGRATDNIICKNIADVSAHHAILCRKRNGEISIIDRNSTNGTYVNGQRIHGEAPLKKGDIVMLAQKYPLQWESIYPPVSPRPRPQVKTWSAIAGVAIVVTGIFLWLFNVNKELTPAEIYAMYKNSVVLIYQQSGYSVTIKDRPIGDLIPQLSKLNYCHIDKDGDAAPGVVGASGTGFFISPHGEIMTNKHVIAPMGKEARKDPETIKKAIQSLLITLGNECQQKSERNQYYAMANAVEVNYEILWIGIGRNDSHVSSTDDLTRCSIVKTSSNEEVDIAIIQTNTKETPSNVKHIVNLKDIAHAEDMEVGDKIYTIGFPKSFTLGSTQIGLEANNQSGEITQERGEYIYGHNITIHQGASGSPVFDCHGRFAGVIVSGFLGISQGYNHAIQPQKASDFFK